MGHNSSVWTATLSLFDEKKEKRKMASSSRDRGSNTCDEETGMTSGTPVTTVETSSGPGNRTRTSRFTTTTTTTTTSAGRRVNISGQDTGRLSIWEVLGIVSTFRQNVERLKLYKATLSVIRFMAVLNFIYTVVGSAFLIIGLYEKVHDALDINQRQAQQFLRLGVFVSLFAPLALSCDLLALRGLRTWRKALLLPWLVLYAIIVALVMAVVLTGTFHAGFHWRYLLLGLCCLCFFSAWRQIRLQYSAMNLPRPTCCTVEDLATDLRAREAQEVISEPLPNDLPPKYDDLEQPPQYEENFNEQQERAQQQ